MTVCGTGGWSGPLPGDPNTNIVLMATPAFGGVDVTWTYPTTNPGAVAHIELYRGLNATFGNAIPLTVVGGNFYYDKNTFAVNTQFFYWGRVVSINGTVGEWVGPAVAIAKPTIANMLDLLNGQIDSSLLAQDLRTELDNIPTLTSGLAIETLARLNDNVALGNALNTVQSSTNQALTLIETEAIERTDNHAALASVVDTLAAGVGSNAAAIVTEQTVRASAYDALAAQIQTIIATGNNAGSTVFLQASAPTTGMVEGDVWYDSDDGNKMYRYVASAWVDISDARLGFNTAAISAETTARIDADTALTTSLTTALSTIGSNTAAISTEATTRANADTALASSITSAQSVLNGNIAAAQTTLQTNIDVVDGKATAIGARYTAKLSVNGLIGGFGIYNDGTEIDAGFDVNTFWIGKNNTYKRKPFIVSGDETFIDQAVINQLTFTKLRDEAGGVMVESGRIKSDFISTKGLSVTDALGNVILSSGTSLQEQIEPFLTTNLTDLSWWKRDATIPWTPNNEFNRIIASADISGIKGPKGYDDLMWFCNEINNDGQAGGGWNGAPVTIDTDKTYRFVVPIYRQAGNGQAYWGIAYNTVCDLNTTTPNGNPYFAYSGALTLGRWYLFVGFVYPAGSTNNTHDGAGIYDCTTGEKVAGGQNYTARVGYGATSHRAYQYYADNGATQLFGRPLVNVVDGSEPSLREYFSASAVLNSSLIPSIATAQSTADAAQTAANTANAAISAKLDKASSEILRIDAVSATRAAGVAVGDLAWNGSGVRTSGKGLALTPYGVLGHNGTKNTFTLNATTGDAYFAGSIEAGTATQLVSTNYSQGYIWTGTAITVGTLSVYGNAVTLTGGNVLVNFTGTLFLSQTGNAGSYMSIEYAISVSNGVTNYGWTSVSSYNYPGMQLAHPVTATIVVPSVPAGGGYMARLYITNITIYGGGYIVGIQWAGSSHLIEMKI